MLQTDIIPQEESRPEGAEGADPSSSSAAAAAAGGGGPEGMPADLGAVPQIPQAMYYGGPAGMPQYPQAVMPGPAVGAGQMGAVPDMQPAGMSPTMQMAEPPVAAVMFEQWASEGQAQAAAAVAQQPGQHQ